MLPICQNRSYSTDVPRWIIQLNSLSTFQQSSSALYVLSVICFATIRRTHCDSYALGSTINRFGLDYPAQSGLNFQEDMIVVILFAAR